MPPPSQPAQDAGPIMPKEGDKLHGLPDNINANKPLKSFKDAMSRVDAKEWQEAYNKEYKGMMDRGAVQAVNPPRSQDPWDNHMDGVQEHQWSLRQTEGPHVRSGRSTGGRTGLLPA